jgi:hypothetical protein
MEENISDWRTIGEFCERGEEPSVSIMAGNVFKITVFCEVTYYNPVKCCGQTYCLRTAT